MKLMRFKLWTQEKCRDILTLSTLYHGSLKEKEMQK